MNRQAVIQILFIIFHETCRKLEVTSTLQQEINYPIDFSFKLLLSKETVLTAQSNEHIMLAEHAFHHRNYNEILPLILLIEPLDSLFGHYTSYTVGIGLNKPIDHNKWITIEWEEEYGREGGS